MKDLAQHPADSVIIIDFETSGLSLDKGDRAIEIGAIKLINGEITDRFQSLISPGFKASSFIEQYTGITNQMLASAPLSADVMHHFATFSEGLPFVAHNAKFDQKFLSFEYHTNGINAKPLFACSLLASRRLLPDQAGHSLGALVRSLKLPQTGQCHRALADAEMTTHLWLRLLQTLEQSHQIFKPSFNTISDLNRLSKGKVNAFLLDASTTVTHKHCS